MKKPESLDTLAWLEMSIHKQGKVWKSKGKLELLKESVPPVRVFGGYMRVADVQCEITLTIAPSKQSDLFEKKSEF